MTDLTNWTGCERPVPMRLEGRTLVLEAFDKDRHGTDLWQTLGGDESANARIRYFPDAPYTGAEHFASTYAAKQAEWHTMVMRMHAHQSDSSASDVVGQVVGQVVGMASYMRIRPEHGSIEVGAVAHGAAMARSAMSTEAHYLLAKHIFEDLGYRRYEWKLNNDNQPSHKAAVRLGFTFEGTFRQDMVTHGANRDTAWYSMLDHEWPSRKAALESWLAPENFDADGRQRRLLESFR
jgi:RimJ/RimL family protein N-acetyltransferase